jgi:hypothetical protein
MTSHAHGPSSSPSTPSHSRPSSIRSQKINQHAPLTPSGLREAHTLSVSPDMTIDPGAESGTESECSPRHTPTVLEDTNIEPLYAQSSKGYGYKSRDDDEAGTSVLGGLSSRTEEAARETTALLRKPLEFLTDHVHPGPCNHGTFSPTVNSRAPSIQSGSSGGGNVSKYNRSRTIFGSLAGALGGGGGGGNKKMSTTERLAQEHGIETSNLMYVFLSFILMLLLKTPC